MDEKDQREADDQAIRQYQPGDVFRVPAERLREADEDLRRRQYGPVTLESVRTMTLDLGRRIPHDQCEMILVGPLADAVRLFVKRQAEYGESAQDLGSMGQYADINRKVKKLKRLMWDKSVPEDAISEDAEQVCMDLIGHLLLSIQFLRDEKDGLA